MKVWKNLKKLWKHLPIGLCIRNISHSLKLPFVFSELNRNMVHVLRFLKFFPLKLCCPLLGDYLLSCSIDQHWAFSDLRTGHVLTRCLSDPNINQGNMAHNSSLLHQQPGFSLIISSCCGFAFWQYRDTTDNYVNSPTLDSPGYRLNLLVSHKSHQTSKTIAPFIMCAQLPGL